MFVYDIIITFLRSVAAWLVKTEPGSYAFEDLLREQTTVWSGVANALAQKHLRSMQKGDDVFFYHSGKEKAIVGLARICSTPYPDPSDGSSARAAVDLKVVRRLSNPVTLATMKRLEEFSSFDLLRMSRLSVLPVPMSIKKLILQHSEHR